MSGRKNASARPVSKRKRSRTAPSLLEMLKEEELAVAGVDFPEPRKPGKRRKTSALLAESEAYCRRALEPTTVRWHKTCAFVVPTKHKINICFRVGYFLCFGFR